MGRLLKKRRRRRTLTGFGEVNEEKWDRVRYSEWC
jgi:hypothetical protein